MSALALTIIFSIVAIHVIETVADWLSLQRLNEPPPAGLDNLYAEEDYTKTLAHSRQSTVLGIVESSVALIILLVFWLIGGFGWLDGLVNSLGWPLIPSGLAFAGLLYLGNHLVRLPFSIFDTFVIEQKFGFNKTTPGLFFIDEIRSLLLTAVLGGGLFSILVALFAFGGAFGWLFAWLAVSAVTLLLMYIGPTVIMPLFNKFERLPDGELRDRIFEFSQRCGFPLEELYEMDGSKRSTRANAFFTGFGRHKRIVFYDTLLKNHPVAELVAILAHEIGHYKLHHIFKRMAATTVATGAVLWLASLAFGWQPLYAAFGVTTPSVPVGLVLLGIALTPLSWIAGIVSATTSRRHEFEADRFAVEQTGGSEALSSGLVKLSKDNLANLNPHPLSVALHYSHPPLKQRLDAMAAK